MTKIQLITSGKHRTSYYKHDFSTFKTFRKNILNNFSFGYLITKPKLSLLSQMNYVF